MYQLETTKVRVTLATITAPYSLDLNRPYHGFRRHFDE